MNTISCQVETYELNYFNVYNSKENRKKVLAFFKEITNNLSKDLNGKLRNIVNTVIEQQNSENNNEELVNNLENNSINDEQESVNDLENNDNVSDIISDSDNSNSINSTESTESSYNTHEFVKMDFSINGEEISIDVSSLEYPWYVLHKDSLLDIYNLFFDKCEEYNITNIEHNSNNEIKRTNSENFTNFLYYMYDLFVIGFNS